MGKIKQYAANLKNLLNKITVKQIILIIIFGIIISLASCVIGYYEFSTNVKNIYNTQISELAQFVEKNLNISEYEQNMKVLGNNFYKLDQPEFEQISKQPGYQDLTKQMDYLQNSVDGLDIFVANYNPSYNEAYAKYLETEGDDPEVLKLIKDEGNLVVCTYYRSPDFIPENRKKNQPGGLFLASDDEKESVERLYEEKTPQYLNSEIIMGDNNETIATLFTIEKPVLNDNGDVIGFIGISLAVNILHQLLSRYLFLVGCLTILIGVIFIIIYILINRRIFLNPILSIIEGTSNFVKNNNQISESLTEIKTGDEIQTLAESILKLEKDINEYIKNLAEVTAERERVQAELDVATNIQMSMLPHELTEIDDRKEFDIHAIMNPAREVGGDFYNYYMIDEDHLGFVVGDVSGKGVPAALFMMIGTILIKTQSLPDEAANAIIERVNDILCDNNEEMLFITAWMGIYEISTGKVTFINAGHEPPLLIHENGESEFVKTKPNLALATFDGLPYRLNELQLKKGDKLFLYTDGVVEAQTEDEEFYKDSRLVEVVEANYQKTVEEIIKLIREDIDVFVNGAEQFDDITIFGLEVKEEPES